MIKNEKDFRYVWGSLMDIQNYGDELLESAIVLRDYVEEHRNTLDDIPGMEKPERVTLAAEDLIAMFDALQKENIAAWRQMVERLFTEHTNETENKNKE